MLLNQKTDFSDTSRMKVGIISDTHEELDDQVITVINDCDIAIHAGDIGSSLILEILQPKTGHVIAVAGNNRFGFFLSSDRNTRQKSETDK